MTDRARRIVLWGVVLPVGILVVLAAVLPPIFQHGKSHAVAHAPAMLRMLAAAQEDFRANDRDGNGKNDYWRGDVSGLYTIDVHGNGPIRLISRPVAAADDGLMPGPDSDLRKAPCHGTWFRALRFADEEKPDPERFAFLAYPDSIDIGRSLFLVTHEHVIYRKRVEKIEPLDVCPSAEELKTSWKILD